MTVVFSAPTFNWHRTREDIAIAALRKLNEVGAGETPGSGSESFDMAIEALDGVLKMLQFQGLQWPNITAGHIEITLLKGAQKHLLPVDYYGFADIQYRNQLADLVTGNQPADRGPLVPLPLLSAARWAEIQVKTMVGAFPQSGFIDVQNTLWIFPILSQNVVCEMFYQKVIQDSSSGASSQLRAPWALALPYGVASELAEEFEVSDGKHARIEQKWRYYRDLCLMNEAEQTHLNISVADNLVYDRRINFQVR